MKASRTNITILLVLIFIVSLPLLADAGIFGSAKDFILDNVIATVVGLFFGLVGTFWGATKLGKLILKAERATRGMIEIARMIMKAKSKESDGGEEMTKKELKAIINKVLEIVLAVIKETTGKTVKVK